MPALAREDVRRLHELEGMLSRYSLRDDTLAEAVRGVRELLDTEVAILYSLRPGAANSELRLDFFHADGLMSGAREVFDRWISANRDRALTKTWNPDAHAARKHPRELIPAAWQRNRALVDRDIVARTGLVGRVVTEVYPKIPGPAYLLTAQGRIVHVNAAARAALDTTPSLEQDLVAAVRAGTARPDLRVVSLGRPDVHLGYLVVQRAGDERTVGAHALAAARRLGLTPAQTRVLLLVVEGLSNTTIAARLDVAERTVESHITAILEKAQVPSRAALIAFVLARDCAPK